MVSFAFSKRRRALKVFCSTLLLLCITACAEKDRVEVREAEIEPPVFLGPCGFSNDLVCPACLYVWQGRYVVMCRQ
jgi:hypothetical protein